MPDETYHPGKSLLEHLKANLADEVFKIFMSDTQDPFDFSSSGDTEDVAYIPEGTPLNYDKWLLLVAEVHQKKRRPLTEKESITCALISLL